ncbi:hypothetical protein PSACC_02890 [Paramicrosporidium saccamoebae]|uniref:Uncharacterized protein n=1 Tax=Paramicrosporidium saccamoebae TaxID=1246581 RepID=A0A2H9THN1_9FUNG|nr:hypothetical protein PSACC_02890 [Paramicrosporidium saccamoebae]
MSVKKQHKRSFFQDILASVWEPGVNNGLLLLMHLSFIILLASLLVMLWVDRTNIHVWILTVISTLLYGTMVWFVSEVAATLKLQQKLKHEPVKSEDTTKVE